MQPLETPKPYIECIQCNSKQIVDSIFIVPNGWGIVCYNGPKDDIFLCGMCYNKLVNIKHKVFETN